MRDTICDDFPRVAVTSSQTPADGLACAFVLDPALLLCRVLRCPSVYLAVASSWRTPHSVCPEPLPWIELCLPFDF